MPVPHLKPRVLFLCVPALFVSLVCLTATQVQNQASAAQKKATIAAKEELKFEEAEAIRRALVLLELANRDYDGHRVKAVHQVKDALHLLNADIMKHGTAQQKAATKQETAAVKAVAAQNNHVPGIHEKQNVSDAQLSEAATLLSQAANVLAKHNQPKALGHVKAAITEIGIALKIR